MTPQELYAAVNNGTLTLIDRIDCLAPHHAAQVVAANAGDMNAAIAAKAHATAALPGQPIMEVGRWGVSPAFGVSGPLEANNGWQYGDTHPFSVDGFWAHSWTVEGAFSACGEKDSWDITHTFPTRAEAEAYVATRFVSAADLVAARTPSVKTDDEPAKPAPPLRRGILKRKV